MPTVGNRILPTTNLLKKTTTTMAPSTKHPAAVAARSSPLFSSNSTTNTGGFAAESFSVPAQDWTQVAAAVHPEEPNLYLIPPQLYPTYRPIPFLVNLIVSMCAFLISAGTTWKLGRLTWLAPIMALQSGTWSPKKVVKFLAKGVIMTAFTRAVIQDVFLPPSRITTSDLIDQYVLPSKLSRYQQLQIPFPSPGSNIPKQQKLGIHWLQYSNPKRFNTHQSAPPHFRAIYFNHGFGASSLSWLPTIPRLVDRLNARVGLGHDACGFGFTERPNKDHLETYRFSSSGQIATGVLQHCLREETYSSTKDGSEESNNENDKPLVLMGHSMGAVSTLQMALKLPKETPKWLVLVAPALGLHGAVDSGDNSKSRVMRGSQRVGGFVLDATSPLFRYILKRVVGGKNFWRKGLETVWGDPKGLKDSDVLRFQWPSIGLGWEDGLVKFSRAQALPPQISDQQAMAELLQGDNNATITIILGSKDKVIQRHRVMKFLEPFKEKVRVYEMDGLGHDPFEEDPDRFVRVVEEALEADKDQIFGSSITP